MKQDLNYQDLEKGININRSQSLSSENSPPETEEDAAQKLANVLVDIQSVVMLELSQKLRELKITHEKYHLLSFLNAKGENAIMMGELARKMGVSTAAGTGTIDRLEKLKFVTRVHDLTDRRKIFVKITPHGIKALEDIRQAIAKIIAENVIGSGQEEAEDNLDLLDWAGELDGTSEIPRN